MLHELSLRNVGPAPTMDVEFGRRLNIFTGDNGLGKSFLFDIAWWALTRRWPHEVNPAMTSGFAARPSDSTIIWAWSEHRLAAERYGEVPATSVILLFDEVESHLHPRWQRSILRALNGLGETLFEGADLQLLVSTHSPLVLASAESWFDAERDAWFDLDLEGDPPSVRLRHRPYTPLGRSGYWLTSDAFDLATDRGNLEAEDAILRAMA